jgi:hypothetical protein
LKDDPDHENAQRNEDFHRFASLYDGVHLLICPEKTIFLARKSVLAAPKPGLDAGHYARQMGFNDLVVCLATVFLAGQEATPLHEPQVFGGHVAGDFARLGKFADRVPTLEEHLHHPKPMGMSQRLEAFRCLCQGIQRRELGQFQSFRLGGHSCASLYSNISEGYDLSMSFSFSFGFHVGSVA